MVNFDSNDTTAAVIGGLIIALGCSLHLLLLGRISGFSCFLKGIVSLDRKELEWMWVFMAGFVFLPVAFYWGRGDRSIPFKFMGENDIQIFDSHELLAGGVDRIGTGVAGFVVGVGAVFANGCTFGHAVCGIPRLAIRSIVAGIIFLVAAIVTQTLKKNIDIFQGGAYFDDDINDLWEIAALVIWVAIQVVAIIFIIKNRSSSLKELILEWVIGAILGLGVAFAGFCRPVKVLGFFTGDGNDWDPSIGVALLVAIVVNLLVFKFVILKRGSPTMRSGFDFPSEEKIRPRLIVGAILFGLGWGLSGLCPGPGLLTIFANTQAALWFLTCLIGLFLGHHIAEFIKKKWSNF